MKYKNFQKELTKETYKQNKHWEHELRLITIKMTKAKDQEKLLKVIRKKYQVMFTGPQIQLMTDFIAEITKSVRNILMVLYEIVF